ncbi:ABC transporter permease [Streptomyces sp. HC44]|uniref:ABC transporter permease n=1 Tax=Streptomyces scabichelini TaxID=2711217 RepID=A0A6G4UYE4_9ACTN|nr:ABC transporter permease [Streptomyces scabichelini]NGO06685.1 ABC transporter permease [Streptomyces scabichelini]
MLTFLVRRVLAGLVLLYVLATAAFAMMSLTGADAARNIAGQMATQDQVAAKSQELGLDRPWLSQYGDWLGHAVRGDFGASWFSGEPVSSSLVLKVPVTLSVVVAGLILATVLSVVLGVAAAVRRGWLDRLVQLTAITGYAVPGFLMALLLSATLAVELGWLPATGYVPLSTSLSGWFRSITLPAISLSIGAIAATAQQVRGSVIDVLRQDFVRTLRSRGLSERRVLFRHVLRNAAPPALTVLSLQFIGLVGGAVIIEKVFGLPGVGSAAVEATVNGDTPLVMGVVVYLVFIVVAVNLLVDFAYGWLNPKVRVR